jgi:hypothetical protein
MTTHTLFEQLLVTGAISFVIGIVLYKHSVAATCLAPIANFILYLCLRDWSDFDAHAIWETPGSSLSWFIVLSAYFVLIAFPSLIGATMGWIFRKQLSAVLAK